MQQAPLTPKEQMVLDFIRTFLAKKGYVPSYEEIKNRFGYASLFSVQQYLKQLENKGYLRTPGGNKKRAIEVLDSESQEALLPLLGRVAAGRPIEAIEQRDMVEVPPSLLAPGGDYFALRVSGDSMIDDGIHDQDIVVIRKQSHAENGQTVVALIDNEATIKRFYRKRGQVELHPANPSYKPLVVSNESSFKIEGILCGLIRRFQKR